MGHTSKTTSESSNVAQLAHKCLSYTDTLLWKTSKKNIKNTNIIQNSITIRDQNAETKWTSHHLDQFGNKLIQDNPTKKHIIPNTNQYTKKKLHYVR